MNPNTISILLKCYNEVSHCHLCYALCLCWRCYGYCCCQPWYVYSTHYRGLTSLQPAPSRALSNRSILHCRHCYPQLSSLHHQPRDSSIHWCHIAIGVKSHTANLQQLTVIPGHAGATTVIFQGKGKGIPMPIVTGRSSDGLGIPVQSTEYQLTLVFTFSTNNGGSFNIPTIRCPDVSPAGSVIITMVTSEDALDNNDNDTTATVVFT